MLEIKAGIFLVTLHEFLYFLLSNRHRPAALYSDDGTMLPVSPGLHFQ